MKKILEILKNRYVIFVFCVLISLAIVLFLIPEKEENKSKYVDVIKMAQTVDKNVKITDEMLVSKKTINEAVPKEAIKDKSMIIGKYSNEKIYPTDFLIEEKFAGSPLDDSLNSVLQGEYAISVSTANLAKSVSSKLEKGDKVCVYGYSSEDKTIIKYTELESVELLEVTDNTGLNLQQAKSQAKSANNALPIPATVILKVNSTQAEKILYLENNGGVHLAYVGEK